MNRKNATLLMVIFAALIAFILTSCDTAPKSVPPQIDPHRKELDNTANYYDQHYDVYTLEGCEYIVVGVGSHQWGSHKGNCKNPIHKHGPSVLVHTYN